MSEPAAALGDWFRDLLNASSDRTEAIHAAYQQLENARLVNRVVLHRYQCRRGCVLGVVVRIDGMTLCRTRDYKLSHGLNDARSVESARRRNTIDGERHWPGHTFDVGDLAGWGDGAGMDMNCRHVTHTAKAVDVLAQVEGVAPGHPGKPTLL